MKKRNVLFTLMMALFSHTFGQTSMTITRTITTCSFDSTHAGINQFCQRVGDVLKSFYPMKVKSIDVTFISDGASHSCSTPRAMTWSAILVSCDSSQADYYFDRRGTIRGTKVSFEKSKELVESDLRKTGKVQMMMDAFDKTYGNHSMPYSFVKKISFFDRIYYWYMEEYFCTAKKM